MEKLKFRNTIDLIARICLSAIFVNAIPVKITNFSNVVSFISNKGFPEPIAAIVLVLAILVLITGTLLLIIGKNETLGAILLLSFIIPATLLFHLVPFESRAVLVNLGLTGGLILLITRNK